MNTYASDVAFTPAVKSIQAHLGSRDSYARMESGQGWATTITPELEEFIAERDSCYMGTATSEGQPYIQHRGGGKGFLRVMDDETIAFADFSGNRQFITTGNLSENDRVFVFLMDYANRRRVKIWGQAKIVENAPTLFKQLALENYPAKIERAVVITVEAWDVNCPQHITPRYSESELESRTAELQRKIAALESELESVKHTEITS